MESGGSSLRVEKAYPLLILFGTVPCRSAAAGVWGAGMKEKQLLCMAFRLALVEEEGRRRIAMDFHDRLGQARLVFQMRVGILRGTS